VQFLDRDRSILERHLPGLDADLEKHGLGLLEEDGTPGLDAFRRAHGPGLLVPGDLAGRGAGPRDAVRVQRAIGSRSPSLAVATTMHHFSIATLVEMTGSGLEWILIEAVAREELLVASGFGEGTPGRGILAPTLRGTRVPHGLVLSGSKRPCSLGRSMDLLTASVDVGGEFAVVLVPAGLPGVERRPFWRSPALAAAESCEVVLRDVEVPDRLVSYSARADRLDRVQVGGFMWFEILIAASYVGVASALVERALGREPPIADLAGAVSALETATAALEAAADVVGGGDRDPAALGAVLAVRFGVQELVAGAARTAVEALGGTAFATDRDVALLFAASAALAFHPPSRRSMAPEMVGWARDGTLRIP
jgi:alkylation response protein AidB-like acyl-CoA dehydrogenase